MDFPSHFLADKLLETFDTYCIMLASLKRSFGGWQLPEDFSFSFYLALDEKGKNLFSTSVFVSERNIDYTYELVKRHIRQRERFTKIFFLLSRIILNLCT